MVLETAVVWGRFDSVNSHAGCQFTVLYVQNHLQFPALMNKVTRYMISSHHAWDLLVFPLNLSSFWQPFSQ
jgi:hypothetical protein